MTSLARSALIVLLAVPLGAAAETDQIARASPAKPRVEARTADTAPMPLRCRLYFGCVPGGRDSGDIARPASEK